MNKVIINGQKSERFIKLKTWQMIFHLKVFSLMSPNFQSHQDYLHHLSIAEKMH